MNIQSDRGTRVLLKHLAAWGIPLGMLTIFAMPAVANEIVTATVSLAPTCDSYQICVSAADLTPGTSYTITYEITVTLSSGTPMTISNSIPFTASNTTFSTCVTQSLGPLTGSNSFSGSATLVGFNTIPITFSPNPLSCPTPCSTVTPTPILLCPNCASSCIQLNFNGTAIPARRTIWFNAHIKASGVSSFGATITFCGSTVTSSAFSSPVPNGVIVFSPSASCATTSFNSSTNTWTTTVPISGSDEIFLTGLAFPSPGLPGGGISPNWCGIFSSSVAGISVQWQWGAAVYTCWPPAPGVYNMLNVKPTHSNACGVNNGDHAGTPQNSSFQCVVGGATGGGGSNFTGSWSGTVSTTPCVP